MNLQTLNNSLKDLAKLIGGFIKKEKIMNIVDISHFNGKINWISVASQTTPFKVDGAIIKCSTGVGSTDPRAAYNATEAKKAGLRIGYYHYCSLNEEDELKDSIQEANWFIQVLKTLPQPDLPIVLDIEDPNILQGIDKDEFLLWIKNFFQILKNNGYINYALYSYTPFLDSHLPPNHGLGNIPLWIAQYRPTLTLPRGWNSYWLWQYDNKGAVKGIVGNVDLNKTK